MSKLKGKLGSSILLLLAIALIAAGCSTGAAKEKKLKLAYVAWDSEIASTHVVEHVLENKLGYEVELLQVDAGPMWAGVSDGSADGMVAAWLPSTHESYYKENEGKFVDLGPNMLGTKIGLVVPTYMEITSIEDLKKPEVAEQVKRTIVGIEPGAGIMMSSEKALEAYGLEGWTLLESSSAAMATELQSAYKDQKPIIVTGWTPHWKFGKMDLKYLEDPQGVYGGDEEIHTIVRNGLDEDQPSAYKFLDQFNWTADEMAAVMVDIQEGASPEEAAKTWVEANADKVNSWLEGIE
jgi:ABC-type proline/glycine betaine transport system substrate-binding protein